MAHLLLPQQHKPTQRQKQKSQISQRFIFFASSFTLQFMDIGYNIFSVTVSEFDQGKKDPFSFDAFSEKLGSKYLPFSGTVRKSIYFFFIDYVNWLWENGKLNSKKKEETRLRLEKLFVYNLKVNNSKKELSGIIGISKETINPFKANDGNWIIQTCFKIYEKSAGKIITDSEFIKRYVRDNPGEEKILNDFLSKEGELDKKNEQYLETLLNRFSKNSLFAGNIQLTKYNHLFNTYLKTAIKNLNPEYYNDISRFFYSTKNLKEQIYKNTIEKKKKYYFKEINEWFSAFILAVNTEIKNENSERAWQKAKNLFSEIPDKEKRDLTERPETRCWFDRNGIKYVEGKDFDENGWNALLRRAKGVNFYDFKHFALATLLQDTY